jgi:nicotinate-nucleotide--dimethylbenzimidazole phosphoribosyltransferase
MTQFEQWLAQPSEAINKQAKRKALEHQQQLTKPAGSLGCLEKIAIQLAGLQSTDKPRIDKVQITVFAADHGIVEEGISAFPQAVTTEMIRNFSRGGAAISVLAKENNASLSVINVGTVSELESLRLIKDLRIASGTANFLKHAAMSESDCQKAVLIGQTHIESLHPAGIQLFIGGEMGIGNTTSATAIACALLNESPSQLAGAGTGLDQAAIQHKAHVIQKAIALHQSELSSPLAILRILGGFEIAALVGAYLHCAKVGLPVLIDGFISSVAALVAYRIQEDCIHWFLFSHQSAEKGHQIILQALKAEPILSLGMRLGEASGAATALPLVRLSCALHNNMATFSQASVSEQ